MKKKNNQNADSPEFIKSGDISNFFSLLKKGNPRALIIFREKRIFLEPEFWKELDVVIPDQSKLNPETSDLLARAREFYDFLRRFSQNISDAKSELLKHIPDCTVPELALNAGKLFAIGAFKTVDPESKRAIFPEWSLRMQKALQELTNTFAPVSVNDSLPRAMSLQALFILGNLLLHEHDRLLWYELIDAWLWEDFVYKRGEDGASSRFIFTATDNSLLTRLSKERIRRWHRNHYYWGYAKEQADNDPLIQYAESKYKVTQGFPSTIHSGGVIIKEQNPNLVSINADEFDDGNEALKGMDFNEKSAYISLRAMLWYSYYHSLRESYWPKDDVKIHELKVSIPDGGMLSLFQLFGALHLLTALSKSIIAQTVNLDMSVKRQNMIYNISKENPEDSEAFVAFEVDKLILYASEHFEFKDYFMEMDREVVINLLKTYCLYTQEDAEKVLKLLTIAQGNEFEFQPLILTGDKIRWNIRAFKRTAMARYLFEKYWMRHLFSRTINGINNASASLMAEKRADEYNVLMKDIFLKQGFKAVTESRQDKIRIDLLAYKDGTLFCIEFKGDNSGIDSFQKRARWKKNNIGDEKQGLVKQFNERIRFLETEEGKNYIEAKLGSGVASKVQRIYPLAVSGTFCFEDFILKLKYGYNARLISFFTLSLLLRGEEPAAVGTDAWLDIALRRIQAQGNVQIPDDFINPAGKSEENKQLIRAFIAQYRQPFWSGDLTAGRLIEMIETDFLWAFINENEINRNIVREQLRTQSITWEH